MISIWYGHGLVETIHIVGNSSVDTFQHAKIVERIELGFARNTRKIVFPVARL
jgi:alanine racemase